MHVGKSSLKGCRESLQDLAPPRLLCLVLQNRSPDCPIHFDHRAACRLLGAQLRRRNELLREARITA